MGTINETSPQGTGSSHFGRWIAIGAVIAAVVVGVVLLAVFGGGGGSAPGY